MKALKYIGGGVAFLLAAVILFAISPICFGIAAVLGLGYVGARAFS